MGIVTFQPRTLGPQQFMLNARLTALPYGLRHGLAGLRRSPSFLGSPVMIVSRTFLASLALALCLGLSTSAGAAERVTSEPRVTTSSIVTGGARAGSAPAASATRSTLPAVASAAALSGDEKLTRLVIDLTRAVDLRAFALADPHRVIVDLDETTFHLPATFGAERRGVIQAVETLEGYLV